MDAVEGDDDERGSVVQPNTSTPSHQKSAVGGSKRRFWTDDNPVHSHTRRGLNLSRVEWQQSWKNHRRKLTNNVRYFHYRVKRLTVITRLFGKFSTYRLVCVSHDVPFSTPLKRGPAIWIRMRCAARRYANICG